MKYKCLVLDHDDTVVSSTKEIHHPAFLEALHQLRPGTPDVTCEEYFRKNFDPGFLDYCIKDFGFTEAELKQEEEIWKSFVKTRIPNAFPGIKEIIARQKAEGGLVVVVSHSFEFNIKRDYEANGLPMADEIFGWDVPKEIRKPSPYVLTKVAEKYGLTPKDFVVVDDLKPGYDMAREFGCTFVGAGWCNEVQEIRDFMKAKSDVYFTDVKSLEQYLFS
ncbi:MAG: HAD family phosphatase [Lachnospiraceae bacterium]|nr:HAD family phosphatase [Lachnospiraceae bacterium]